VDPGTFQKGPSQGSGGCRSPSGVQGQSPSRGLGDKVPQKLKQMWNICTIVNRERTIIGSVSYRNQYWTNTGCIVSDRIGYCCIGRYYVHHCRLISCWRDRITHDDQRAFKRPVTRPPSAHACVLFYGPWYGRGLEGRETEGDCNLIPASPWHKDRAVLVLATITPHSLHQQEVITTVSCQSL